MIICCLAAYYNIAESKRKLLLIIIASVTPLLLFAFYAYSVIRLGRTLDAISITDAIQVLFGQEIGYPMLYDDYIKKSGGYISDYLTWLILLPFPGFMKFGMGDFFLNREFSMCLLGVDASDSTFFILLPGLVGEAIFVFGPVLFFLHAIILGYVIKFVTKTFTSNRCFDYVYYLCIVQFSFMLARAGSISVYPSMFKSFLILVIVCHFISKKYAVKK